MFVHEDRVIAAVAVALTAAGVTCELPGQKLSDAQRGTAWVRINVMGIHGGKRNPRSNGLLSLQCFTTTANSAYSAIILADTCINAIGDSLSLLQSDGLTAGGLAAFLEPSKCNPPNDDYLRCDVDTDFYYVTA